jgi:hypothetical protein
MEILSDVTGGIVAAVSTFVLLRLIDPPQVLNLNMQERILHRIGYSSDD